MFGQKNPCASKETAELCSGEARSGIHATEQLTYLVDSELITDTKKLSGRCVEVQEVRCSETWS